MFDNGEANGEGKGKSGKNENFCSEYEKAPKGMGSMCERLERVSVVKSESVSVCERVNEWE